MDSALGVVITALVGVATGAAATAYKSRKDLEVQYDIALRGERIAAYKALWEQLAPLAYYSPQQPLTRKVAREVSAELRTWYYDTGGLLMSEGTREPYFDLQRALKAVGGRAAGTDTKIDAAEARALKQLGSRLRTSTTDDVATRVGPLLTHSVRAWLRDGRRGQALVTVTRGWQFDPAASGVWRVRVVNRSSSRPLSVTSVWLEADGVHQATALDQDDDLPRTLYPREAWQGFVKDPGGLMHGVGDPFRAGRASGPGWEARSRSGGDPPASVIPADGKLTPQGVRDVTARPPERP